MLTSFARAALAASFVMGGAGVARGESAPDPDRLQLKPTVELRLRYEAVDQAALDADALTVRLRGGAQATLGPVSFLAEIEGTAALIDNYNAFPFPLTGESQSRPQYAVVADPSNAELNRFQLEYKSGSNAVTIGRQRINLDDQRWVGSVGWRQNEQTFDALRGATKIGPVTADLTYAIDQRTVFGTDAGPRSEYDGTFIFAGLASKAGPVEAKLFAYLLDYDEDFFLANSSKSFGIILASPVSLGPAPKLMLRASYARQSDYGANPFDYSADYLAFEGGTSLAGFTLTAGWEKLGSDNGRGLQTPMATLHKFNGWADLFLTTPPAGLEDAYLSIGRKFDRIKALPGLNTSLVFHQFDSAAGNLEYGTEWDASIGFKLGPVALLAKFADYNARGFGRDVRKLWVQSEWVF